MVEVLDRRGMKSRLDDRLVGALRESTPRLGMQRVPLGDHRIAGGDRRGEVATGDPVKGERKVVRTDAEDGATERTAITADVRIHVDQRASPGRSRDVLRRLGGLSQLAQHPIELHLRQSRFERQSRLLVCDPRDLGSASVDPLRHAPEEPGDPAGFGRRHRGRGVERGGRHGVEVLLVRDRERPIDRLPGRGIPGMEGRPIGRGVHPGSGGEGGRHDRMVSVRALAAVAWQP